jgi:hypothetical protein
MNKVMRSSVNTKRKATTPRAKLDKETRELKKFCKVNDNFIHNMNEMSEVIFGL